MLTSKQRKCIELLVDGCLTQKKIAETIKVSEQTICNWKKNAEFIAEHNKMMRLCIQSYAAKAFNTHTQLLNARSEMVRYMVAKDILDRSGFKPEEKVEIKGNINDPFEGLSTDDLKKLIDDD